MLGHQGSHPKAFLSGCSIDCVSGCVFFGFGAFLLQDGQPVEFAFEKFTETQRTYAQREKEQLAIQFGMQNFHHYVHGSQVLVENDHKPLVGQVDKPIDPCTPRIQRMRLQLQVYSYQLCYKPGK